MDSVKHPGTILASVDLVAIIALWVTFQRQIGDLKKQVESLDKNDDKLKNDFKTQIDAMSKQIDVLTQNMSGLIGDMKKINEAFSFLNSKSQQQEQMIKHLAQQINKISKKNHHVSDDDEDEEEEKMKKVARPPKNTLYHFNGKDFVPVENKIESPKNKSPKVAKTIIKTKIQPPPPPKEDSDEENDVDAVVAMATKAKKK